MHLKTTLLCVVILVMAVSSASAYFIPPHPPAPVVTPTPAPTYHNVNLDFSVSSQGRSVVVNGYSSEWVSPLASWSWQFSNGKQITGTNGQIVSKILSSGKYTIGLTMSDPVTMSTGRVVKKSVVSV